MNAQKEIFRIIKSKSSGTLFTPKDFLRLASYNNAKLVLSRLCKSGALKRLIDGLYYVPSFSKLTNTEVPVSPFDFAKKISDIYDWSICVSGEAALNYLGLSTQVPAKYFFVSDGPNRLYNIGGTLVTFKHSSRNIKNTPFLIATILEAIKYLGKGNLTTDDISIIRNKLTKKDQELLLSASKKSTVWMFNTVNKIINNNESHTKKKY